MNNDFFFNNENNEDSSNDILNNIPQEILEPDNNENIDNTNANNNELIVDESNSNNSNELIVDEASNNNCLHIYKCNDCGIIFSNNNSNNKCVYCGKNNALLLSNNIDDVPYMIPFKIDKNAAINKYKNNFKFNPLVPLIFKKKNTISSIEKVYISTELSDVNVSGNISFFAGDKEMKDNKEKIKKYDVKNTVNFDFKNIMVCGNSKISKKDFYNINDYDLTQIQQFNSALLIDDTSIIYSDLSPMDISNNITNVVMDYSLGTVKKNINHQLKKIRDNKLAVKFTNNKSVLVPLYLLNVNYNGKFYTYLMNGQTGKSKVNITYGKKELIITSLILFFLIFIISLLIVYFL